MNPVTIFGVEFLLGGGTLEDVVVAEAGGDGPEGGEEEEGTAGFFCLMTVFLPFAYQLTSHFCIALRSSFNFLNVLRFALHPRFFNFATVS